MTHRRHRVLAVCHLNQGPAREHPPANPWGTDSTAMAWTNDRHCRVGLRRATAGGPNNRVLPPMTCWWVARYCQRSHQPDRGLAFAFGRSSTRESRRRATGGKRGQAGRPASPQDRDHSWATMEFVRSNTRVETPSDPEPVSGRDRGHDRAGGSTVREAHRIRQSGH